MYRIAPAKFCPDPPKGKQIFSRHMSSPAVEHVTKDLDSEMGHTNFVHVREARGKTGFTFSESFITWLIQLPM